MGMCMSKTGMFLSPDIKVVNARVLSMGLSGVNIELTLKAINSNPADLPVTRIVYLLKKVSDGSVLAEGVANKQYTIRASTTSDIKIPVTFKYIGVGAASKSLIRRGKTEISVSGDITFDAPMAPGGTATSKFNDELQIDLNG